jgi:uncharacterized protein YdaU (DUF1376 family)
MNYYPHHIGDYKSATMHLSNEEDLAYRRLLEMYYDTELPIPLETQWVARRLRVGTQALESVLNDFFINEKTGWTHPKCDLVIREYHEMAEKNRRNGKLGGRPKTNKQAIKNPVGSQSDPSGNPVVTQVKANQEPITKTKNQKPSLSPAPAALDERFERFWKAYPKKTGKDAALASFKKRKPDDKLLNEMIFAVGQQKKSAEWLKDNGQFIPNPATWLNQGRWMDEGVDLDKPANPFAGDI